MATVKKSAAAKTGASGSGAKKVTSAKAPAGKTTSAKVTAAKATSAKSTGKKAADATAKPKSGGKPASLAKGKDPKGGLTAEGRRYFKEKEGLNLKPGVKGKADTPEKMMRKGSFLRRHFANPPGPVKDDKGEPTRQALQAAAWGEPVPQNEADEKKLAEKGAELLDEYHAKQDGGAGSAKKAAAKKAAGKKTSAKKAGVKKASAEKAGVKKAAAKEPAGF